MRKPSTLRVAGPEGIAKRAHSHRAKDWCWNLLRIGPSPAGARKRREGAVGSPSSPRRKTRSARLSPKQQARIDQPGLFGPLAAEGEHGAQQPSAVAAAPTRKPKPHRVIATPALEYPNSASSAASTSSSASSSPPLQRKLSSHGVGVASWLAPTSASAWPDEAGLGPSKRAKASTSQPSASSGLEPPAVVPPSEGLTKQQARAVVKLQANAAASSIAVAKAAAAKQAPRGASPAASRRLVPTRVLAAWAASSTEAPMGGTSSSAPPPSPAASALEPSSAKSKGQGQGTARGATSTARPGAAPKPPSTSSPSAAKSQPPAAKPAVGSFATPAKESPAKQAPAKQAPAKQTPANPSPANPTPANPTPAKQTPAKQAPAKQAPAKQTPAKQTPANPTLAKQTPANPTLVNPTLAKQTLAKQTPANPTPANPTLAKQTPAKQTPAKQTPAKPLRCDKCDGAHDSARCPHYNKARDRHPDAQPGAKGIFGSDSTPLLLHRGRVVRQISLFKILFRFKALLWDSIILLLPPPLPATPILFCNTIARPLRNIPPPPCMSYTIQYW